MATDRIRYVNAASSGGDGTTTATSGANAAYATMHAALAGEYALVPNLVTSDLRLIIYCVGTSQDSYASSVGTTTAPFTTDSTRCVIIETPLADRGANPYAWSTSRYRWVNAVASSFQMRNVDLTLRGLQLECTRNATDANFISIQPNTSGKTVVIEECIFRLTGATNTGNSINIGGGSSGTFKVRNNILIATTPTTTGSAVVVNNSSMTAYIDNNTIVGHKSYGIRQIAGTVTARNNLVDLSAGSGACFSGTITQSYNSSSDTTATGTGSRSSQTFTYVGAPDYRLSGSDAGAKGYGTDLSAASGALFTTDLGQVTRAVPWDIGAHQVSVGGGLSGTSVTLRIVE